MADATLARSLAMAHRILFVAGHASLAVGHASARDDAGRILVKPRGLGLEELAPDDVAEMDDEGRQRAGRHPLHREMQLHTEIYRARPDVASIVHTHPPNAVRLSIVDRTLRAGTYTQDEVPFARDGIGWYPSAELIDDVRRGRALARSLGARRAAILANHGIVTVGSTVVEATVRAVLLERALRSRAEALAAVGGRIGRLRSIPAPMARRMAAEFDRAQPGRDQAVWAYLEREAERELGPVAW